DARNGKMFILVDDEERENEGDLIIPAQMATPDVINFMAKFGRGLICLSLTQKRVNELGLTLMSQNNNSRHQTAFTVSIEAKDGISTGISAPDRARTIAIAIDPTNTKEDIVSPGHVFPLVAKDGGVLVRAGHTEASIDIAKLAGLNHSGVICEIMKDDGTMARMPDLVEFAQEHQLKIATIADLISYRRRHDKLVERILETSFNSKYGGIFQAFIYVNKMQYCEHLVLVKGNIKNPTKPILVRMHTVNILNDMLGDLHNHRSNDLIDAMQIIEQEEQGVIVLLSNSNKFSLSTNLQNRVGNSQNIVKETTNSSSNVNIGDDLRDYGIGAQILADLGIKDMIILSNSPRSIVGIDGYGISVAGYRKIRE
ncbi:MAG: 3,4-dihydroxy-2-butanone-4-phosphate synthase, partial [Pseudomonadota bacterium]